MVTDILKDRTAYIFRVKQSTRTEELNPQERRCHCLKSRSISVGILNAPCKNIVYIHTPLLSHVFTGELSLISL
jgi:hypothetical protein